MKLELRFGALSPQLSDQLHDANVTVPNACRHVPHWQNDANAITRLRLRGFLTEAETRRAQQRLINAIAARVRPVESPI